MAEPRVPAYPGTEPGHGHPPVRLAELIAALSLATDLGLGQPMEHVLRSCRVSLRLGEDLGLDESERAVTYYVGLLAWMCCHADAYEQAAWFGDDIALRAGTYEVDMAGLPMLGFMLRHVGAGNPPLRRVRTAASLLATGTKEIEGWDMTHCRLAGVFAVRLGLGPEVRDPLLQIFERWDGKGAPAGLKGQQIALPVRLVQLGEIVEVFHRRGGVEAAVEVARERSGTQFDPALVERFCRRARELVGDLDETSSWEAVIDAEPALRPTLSDSELDAALEAVADFADLKSPYTSGHSRAVARLAGEAARGYGLPERDVFALGRAALVHDLGRLGVSNAIWDKPGPLTPAELERVRLHPYFTERILAASPGLAPLGAIAAQHHERLDGSGYPRGLAGSALGPAARILAAADTYQAMLEPRPHRPARSPDEAAAELRAEVKAGRLDGEAANAVLRAGGHRVRRRREWAAGLTPREVEVLRLVARGRSNKQIARELYVTPKTVANHVEHIYMKIDVSSRAGASLFAMQHGLLPELPATEK